MDIFNLNARLAEGEYDATLLFPQLARLKSAKYIFKVDFGLSELPEQPGILLIRGARQYGKSTWLEQQILNTIKKFGGGTAFYLNGETISDIDTLENQIENLISAFKKNAPVQRIFIDEITAIQNWEIALKRMADRGKLASILVVTTGSKATDLRRGAEKLPGRKGKLARTTYLFTPISYKEFKRVCGHVLGSRTIFAYLLSGGSPVACAEFASQGILPEYVIELARDWVEGEIASSGRSRSALLNVMSVLYRLGGSPVGQAKLSREAGLANNTVAAGYIEILNDLGCVTPAYPWDQHRKISILRKPCKYHFTNLLVALAYHPARIRSIDDFLALPEQQQGVWYEWLIAQELQRRAAILGKNILAPLPFWQNAQHEIDFVDNEKLLIEVKRGNCSALEFGWFPHQFPHQELIVINNKHFTSKQITGMLLEEFMQE